MAPVHSMRGQLDKEEGGEHPDSTNMALRGRPLRRALRLAALLSALLGGAATCAPPPTVSAESVARSLWATRDLFKTDVHAVIRCGGDGAPRFRLSYMPCRNRGEILRLMLEEARVPYEVEVVGFERWKHGVKRSTPHGKLPVLRDLEGSGTDLGQEGAITRYLADKLGLAGKTDAERAQVDALYCQWFATLRNHGVSHDGEHFSVAALKEPGSTTAGDVARFQDTFRQNSLSRKERSLSALRFFEERLSEQGTGYLAGPSPTYVDLGLFYVLFELAEDDNVPDFAERFRLPQLGAFLARMQERPQILDYLKSPRRMPRYARDASGASLYTYVAGRYSPELEQAAPDSMAGL